MNYHGKCGEKAGNMVRKLDHKKVPCQFQIDRDFVVNSVMYFLDGRLVRLSWMHQRGKE